MDVVFIHSKKKKFIKLEAYKKVIKLLSIKILN